MLFRSEPSQPADADGAVIDVDGDSIDAPFPAPSQPIVLAAPLLTAINGCVSKKTLAAWAQITATISQLEAPDIRNSPARMIRLAVEADYKDYLEANYEKPWNRLEDLEQLANYAQQFTSTAEFLSQLALQTNLEADRKSTRLNSSH